MRSPKAKLFIILVLTLFLVGCQKPNREPILFFKNMAGDLLMTDLDLETFKVISTIEGSRGLYIVPKDKNKIEELTTKTLNDSIEIYFKNELIHSSKVDSTVKGINLLFNDMDEESLERLELLLGAD